MLPSPLLPASVFTTDSGRSLHSDVHNHLFWRLHFLICSGILHVVLWTHYMYSCWVVYGVNLIQSRPSFILPVCAIVNKVVPTQLSFLYSPAQCILTSWTCYCEGDDNDNWNWAIIQFLTNRRVSLTAWMSLILWILFLVVWNEWVHRDFTFHLGSLQLVHNLLTTLNIRWHFSPLYIFPM